MQSNYVVVQCERKNIQVWWPVIWDFTVSADSWPPNMLLPVDTWGHLLLAHLQECKCIRLQFGLIIYKEWGHERGLAAVL